MKPALDVSLYVVTGAEQVPAGRTVEQQVEAALAAGATAVQLREKTLATGAFVERGRALHALTRRHGVPLLINDRVDVALAVGCEGVHLGADDIAYADARRLLGPHKLIGLSVADAEQAQRAAATGCDYVGVGPVFATATKPDHRPPLGTAGLRALLRLIATLPDAAGTDTDMDTKARCWGRDVPVVAIGGITLANAARVLYQSEVADDDDGGRPGKRLAGLAVVSAVMASPMPARVCGEFRELLQQRDHPVFAPPQLPLLPLTTAGTPPAAAMAAVCAQVARARPLVHHITNSVVRGFSANVALAVGASPLMSQEPAELAEIADLARGGRGGGSLVLNMGTSGTAQRPLFAAAVAAYNTRGCPVVFDPVGAGATSVRRETAHAVVGGGYCDVIKGNEAEIRTLLGLAVRQRGVDSDSADVAGSADPAGSASSTDFAASEPAAATPAAVAAPSDSTSGDGAELARARIAKSLARRERNIVVMTGPVDYVSDGTRTFAVHDGHALQAAVTGSGCALASVIAAFVATHRDRKLLAVLAAVAAYDAAARAAAATPAAAPTAAAPGPGTWRQLFLDRLFCLRHPAEAEALGLGIAGRVAVVDV